MSRSIKEQLDELKYEIQANARFGAPDPNPHRAHADLVRRAELSPPEAPMPTVSSFSDWILGLYCSNRDANALRMGKDGENYVEQLRKARTRLANRSPDSGWELEFSDNGENTEPYIISSLHLDGIPLRAKPDRVLRQRSTGNRLIVEIKTTRTYKPIPRFGWPNLKAQLWCYGLIDAFRDAPKVLLTGEILDFSARRLYLISTWDSDDPAVHAECGELFTLFGGTYVPIDIS